MPDLPPWLDTTPNSFLAATEAGQSAGESQRRTDIGVDEFQQQQQQAAISQAAAIAAEHQKLQMAQKAAAMDSHITAQKNQQDFITKMQNNSILDQYRQSQIGLQKDKLAQAAQDSATRFAQSQTKETDLHADAQAKIQSQSAGRDAVVKAQQQKIQMDSLKTQISSTQKELMRQTAILTAPGMNADTKAEAAKEIAKLKGDLKGLVGEMASGKMGTDGAPSPDAKPLPVPKSKDELVKGNSYITAKGIAVWDGTNFVGQ